MSAAVSEKASEAVGPFLSWDWTAQGLQLANALTAAPVRPLSEEEGKAIRSNG